MVKREAESNIQCLGGCLTPWRKSVHVLSSLLPGPSAGGTSYLSRRRSDWSREVMARQGFWGFPGGDRYGQARSSHLLVQLFPPDWLLALNDCPGRLLGTRHLCALVRIASIVSLQSSDTCHLSHFHGALHLPWCFPSSGSVQSVKFSLSPRWNKKGSL